MADNAQKTPVVRSLNLAAQKQVLDFMQLTGKALPCSVMSVAGWIVTVKFEVQTDDFTLPQVTMPVAVSNYDFLPLQKGDFGITMSADTYIGNVSGLGGGNSFIDLVSNLSALVFVPVGNVNFTAPTDVNSRVVQGPNGVVVQDIGKKSVITITPNGVTIVLQSGKKVAITGDLTVTGEITAGFGTGSSVTLQHHKHGTGSPAAGTSVPTGGT